MKTDIPALRALRDHLDAAMYPLVDLRMSLELEPSLTGFPTFDSLQRVLMRLSPAHEALFRLLRLGETVDDEQFRQAFPDSVAGALLETGLVLREPDGGWRTPGLVVVPIRGLLLIAGAPPSYPTAVQPSPAWFDLSTSFVAAALPGSLSGKRVLDVCSGTGVLSLLCATLSASQVVGLELSDSAVAIASANAALNGVPDVVEFRRSDMLSALREDEEFDFVVANLPYAPVICGTQCPSTVAGIGNSVLWPLLGALPSHLAESASGMIATWRSAGNKRSTYQLDAIAARLGGESCAISVYLDPAFDTVEGVLRMVHKDLAQRPGVTEETAELLTSQVGALLAEPDLPMDCFYNQLVHFSRTPGEPGTPETTVFGLAPFGV